jgi:transposase-like protein
MPVLDRVARQRIRQRLCRERRRPWRGSLSDTHVVEALLRANRLSADVSVTRYDDFIAQQPRHNEIERRQRSTLTILSDAIAFPAQHRVKLHSTNPLERVNGEIKRRTEIVGIFPNEDDIVRLVGAILLEQNDEWAVQRGRYMTLETTAPLSDDPAVSLPAIAS